MKDICPSNKKVIVPETINDYGTPSVFDTVCRTPANFDAVMGILLPSAHNFIHFQT